MKPPIRPSIRIGMQPGTRAYRIERNVPHCVDCKQLLKCFFDSELRDRELNGGTECWGYEGGSWCLWINPASDFTHGTYLKLHDDGKVERVTLHPSGYEDIMLIKPPDKELT